MWVFLYIVVATALIIFLITKINKKKTSKLKLKAEGMGAVECLPSTHIEGLGIAGNTLCDLYMYDDKILIDAKTQKFEIKFERLRVAAFKSEKEIIETGKSVVGRAVIGTILLPGLGTLIGGISGVGSKKKTGETNYYFILNYLSINGEMLAVTFKNNIDTIRMMNFCKKINESSARFRPEVIQL